MSDEECIEFCPSCGIVEVGKSLPTCAACWDVVPARLRCGYIAARARRVKQPERFRDTWVAVRQWSADQRTQTRRSA